jgi:hypothetical protein
MTQPTMRSTQLVIAMPDIFEWLEERIYGSECSITDATAGKLPPNQLKKNTCRFAGKNLGEKDTRKDRGGELPGLPAPPISISISDKSTVRTARDGQTARVSADFFCRGIAVVTKIAASGGK